MARKSAKPVRPIETTSVLRKKFRRVNSPRKLVNLPLHPALVAADLKQGSLESLGLYLLSEESLPDREVALELCKLILGQKSDSKYRLVVIDHPDGPPSKGGRPKSDSAGPSAREISIAAEFWGQFETIGKAKLAREQAATNLANRGLTVSTRTVGRAVKKVERFGARTTSEHQLKQRRKLALKRLRRD